MTNCINCKSKNMMLVVEIEPQPLSGVFLDKKIKNQTKYPLNLYRCEKCKLVQFKKRTKNKNVRRYIRVQNFFSNLMISHIYKKVNFLKKKIFKKMLKF